jgi:hypothetical protein
MGQWERRQAGGEAGLSSSDEQLFQYIKEALERHGQIASEIPCRVVSRKTVQEITRRGGWGQGKSGEAWRQAFGRSLKNLKKASRIENFDKNNIWVNEEEEHSETVWAVEKQAAGRRT